MSENSKINYLEDIKNYLLGRLSDSRMHAIEKAALEDPFLADAIEGVESVLKADSAQSFDEDVKELKHRLKKAVGSENRAVVPILKNMWWKAAVAAGIIAIGMGISLNIDNSRSSQSMALSKNEDQTRQEEERTMSKDSPAMASTEKQSLVMPEKHRALQPPLNKKADSTGVVTDDEAAMNLPAAPMKTPPADDEINSSASPGLNDSRVVASESNVQEQLQGRAAGVVVGKNNKWRIVKGKVIDANGEPLIATLSAGRSKSVISDSNGDFSFQIPKNDSVVKLSAAAIGYEPNTEMVDAKKGDLVIMRMKPSNASLSEVAVVGYGTVNQRLKEKTAGMKKAERESRRNFEPEGGWIAFDNYIMSNKKNPGIAGKEMLAFSINTTGRPANFEIIKSLSPAHDAEAIRLVKNGPSWKLIEGRKRKITLTIEF